GNTAVVSSVNVVNGIVKWLGGKAVEVPGATGYLDTDYEGKAEGVLRALEKSDFVIVHVQAPDEAGHEGDAAAKARAISDFDKRLLGRCLKALRKSGLIDSCRIAVLPDHFTPVRLGRHAGDPVPFLLYRPGVMGEGAREYSEAGAKKGSFGVVDGKRFMQLFFGPAFEAKAVFFDLWSTLLHPSKRREYGEVKKILGLGMGYGQYVGMQEKYWFASPCMSEEKYLEIFCKKAGAAADEATVKRLARVWRKWRNRMRLFPEVRGVLEELGKKHRLAIVSNTEPATKEVEERHGLGKFFDATMYSCDAGVLKPDKRIFLEAARRLRVKPRECVMVGDNLRDDVAGAKKAGMKAVWVDRKGKGIASGARKRRRPGPDAVVGDLRELVDKKIL
ncbi:MAG: HAD-IA family hydrolase, partial [Candidatus Micrarchaeota archaeon]|nr:HAD-IA family hydrolase [Candidatus Micrarchaeota archaeon]